MEEQIQKGENNSRGLGPREREVITNLKVQPDYCVRLYRDDGKIFIFADQAWAYQAWGWKVIKRLLRRGLVVITVRTNPKTKRSVKYLCLSK